VLVSGAYSQRDTIEEGSSTVRWGSNVGNFAPGFESAPAGGPTLAQLNSAFHPRFPRYDHFDNHGERIGLTASIQWRPSDKTLVTLDGLYADFKATRRELYLEAPSFSTGGACTAANKPTNCGVADFNVVSATIDSNNVLTKGVFNDVDLRMEHRFDELDTKFKQVTLLVAARVQRQAERRTAPGPLGVVPRQPVPVDPDLRQVQHPGLRLRLHRQPPSGPDLRHGGPDRSERAG
jgi:iron complex outermembrane receptor protein